jgi:hypothetical protein
MGGIMVTRKKSKYVFKMDSNAKTKKNNHETTKLRKHEIGKAFGRRLTRRR